MTIIGGQPKKTIVARIVCGQVLTFLQTNMAITTTAMTIITARRPTDELKDQESRLAGVTGPDKGSCFCAMLDIVSQPSANANKMEQ